jgi:O-antigen/teichoic acid export membrane protein
MQGKAGLFFLATAGWTISQAAVTAVALFLGYGVDGILLSGLFCSIFLAIALSIYQYHSTGIRFSPSLSLSQARFGGMLVLAGIAAFILESSGRWMLASEAGVQVLAEYALAWKIGIMALLFTEPFAMWWLPKRFTVLNEEGKQQCASITEIGVVIALISVVAIACAGPFLVTILSPKEYHSAIQYIPAFAVLAGIKAVTNLFMTGILTEKKTLWPIYIDSGTAVIALAGNLIFIPYFQAWGAIFALTIALIMRLFLYLYIGQRINFIPYQLYRMGLLFFITLAIPVIAGQADNPIFTLLLGTLGSSLLLLCAIIIGSIPIDKLCILFTATHISPHGTLARKK